MSYGDIPAPLKERLASNRFRMYHAMWHLVRSERRWNELTPNQQIDLEARGWKAPRFEGTENAGIDFLFMHREMISMVNQWHREILPAPHDHGVHDDHHVTAVDFVVPWISIPWNHDDPVWPMPIVDLTDPRNARLFGSSKDVATSNRYRDRVLMEFDDRNWLRNVSVDELGTLLEGSLHGWMHMHWSSATPENPNSLDTDNDWLGSPFSSHVNKHFWKLHGWIDQRIIAWADANGVDADLSDGWDGPVDEVTLERHSAAPELFKTFAFDKMPPLQMFWDDLLLEDELD